MVWGKEMRDTIKGNSLAFLGYRRADKHAIETMFLCLKAAKHEALPLEHSAHAYARTTRNRSTNVGEARKLAPLPCKQSLGERETSALVNTASFLLHSFMSLCLYFRLQDHVVEGWSGLWRVP